MTAPPSLFALPILLDEPSARAYLGGADPALLSPPIRLGRRRFWSRLALDRAVAEKAGLPADGATDAPSADEAWGSAYDQWKKSGAA